MFTDEICKSMHGKRALITGGSKGIGAKIAETFAKVGVDVGVIGRNEADLNTVKTKIESHGSACYIIKADLDEVSQGYAAGDAALTHSEHWDILVHSAGVVVNVPLLELSQAQWDSIQNVNLRSIVFLSQKIVPPMIKHGGGKIINISSVGAWIGTPGLAAYAASKGGLNQLTRTMACEWGPHNIQVNAICPTIIMTDMGHKIWDDPTKDHEVKRKLERIPLHRFGEPEDVAYLALFLASPGADYMNGVSVPLEGGMLSAP